MPKSSDLTEVEALAWLSDIPFLGSVKIRQLVDYFGSAEEACSATEEQVEKLPGFGPKILFHWKSQKESVRWKKNLELALEHKVQLISYTDSRYPKKLLEIADYPTLLYIKGEMQKADDQSIAVVGTRQASIYGQEMTEQITHDLSRMGFTIVSGLARGIDTIAHLKALQTGRTIAVIGSGLGNIYPKENSELAEQICKKGALISEFSMMTPPDKQNFPRRNRIVSGMTLGTVLIEAPVESGAMITMERALTQNRKTFAIPGRADSENFRGNHKLIKKGLASLVESANDILEHFECLFSLEAPQESRRKIMIDLDDKEENLWKQLPVEEISFDQIHRFSQLPTATLNVLLMSLVLKKAVKEFPGKIYKRMPLTHRKEP